MYLLTMISFVVGMVELIIGGILDLIAENFNVTTGQAGLLITMFALVFGISGPVLLFLTRRYDRKRVTLAAMFAFFLGCILAIFSPSYSILLLSRIISASSGALLTVLSLTLAAHISKPEYRGRAIGLVVMGISGSIVLGLPLGVSLGHAFGWRSPFILVAILTIILFVCVMVFFGSIKTSPPASLKEQWNALKNKKVFFAHLTTFFFLAGHFTLYGYLTPFVISKMGFDGAMITIVYFVYGAAAVTGGGIAGICADRFGVRPTLLSAIVLLGVCLFVIPFTPFVLFWILLVIWGILSWAITPPIQSHVVQLAPETADIQQSLNNAALHLGIALGTSLGSVIADSWSVEVNPFVGVILVVITLGTALVTLKKERDVVPSEGKRA